MFGWVTISWKKSLIRPHFHLQLSNTTKPPIKKTNNKNNQYTFNPSKSCSSSEEEAVCLVGLECALWAPSAKADIQINNVPN